MSASGTPTGSLSLVRRSSRLPARRNTVLEALPPTSSSELSRSQRNAMRRTWSLPGIFEPTRPDERLPGAVVRHAHSYYRECERQGILPAKREVVTQSLMASTSSSFLFGSRKNSMPKLSTSIASTDSTAALPSLLAGDRHVIAWCNSGFLDGRSELKLHDAKLADAGLSAIAARLGDEMETIDLKGNSIGPQGAEALGRAQIRRLETLVLSNNSLGDLAVTKLFEGLLSGETGPQLVRLTLADNQLSYGARAIGNWLPTQKRLTLLDVHWNYIAGDGALGLFTGMAANAKAGGCLARVDLSWNCLANSGAAASIGVLAQSLAQDCPLIHLDLSYNALQPKECEVLGRGLRSNHSLLGLHLVGNAADVDANGFVTSRNNPVATLSSGAPFAMAAKGEFLGQSALPAASPPRQLSDEERDAIRAVFTSIDTDGSGAIDEDEFLAAMDELSIKKTREEVRKLMKQNDENDDGVIDIDEFTKLMESLMLKEQQRDWKAQRKELEMQRDRSAFEAKTSCWICESWREIEISWEGDAKAVWLFCSVDDYRHAVRMLDKGGGKFSCLRMLPPEEVDDELQLIPGLATETLVESAQLKLRSADGPPLKGDKAVRSFEEVSLMKLDRSCKDNDSNSEKGKCRHSRAHGEKRGAVVVLDDPSNPRGFRVVPRNVEPKCDDKEKVAATRWTYEKSVFAKWEPPTQKVLESCFDSDWAHVKFRRFIKSEEQIEQAAMAFKRHYEDFYFLYRRYAAMSPTGASPFGVGMKNAHDLLGAAGVTNAATCHAGEIETIFIAARVVEHRADKRPFVVKPGDTLIRFQFLEFLLRTAIVRYFQTKEASTVDEAIRMLFACFTPLVAAARRDKDTFLKEFQTEACDRVLANHQEVLDTLYRNYCGLNKGVSRKQFEEMVVSAVSQRKSGTKESAYAFLLAMQTYPDEYYDLDFAFMSLVEFYYGIGAIVHLRTDDKNEEDEEDTLASRMEQFIKSLSQGRIKNLLRVLK
eukprot:TRINITY_DN9745_c0_g1_i2.p1 TRINITY_DN9745_c0_g1~~TRINITY_DN9745_c0_g1_i2.p1  ORF type:complete len:991 (-),score=202.28 TRINITY_DN9745_c0_g1_i2:161-3133(-)